MFLFVLLLTPTIQPASRRNNTFSRVPPTADNNYQDEKGETKKEKGSVFGPLIESTQTLNTWFTFDSLNTLAKVVNI